jgi:predicted Zn-dependent protease
MKKIIAFIFIITFTFACSTVPITGRKQLTAIPSSQMLSLSYSSYGELISKSKLSSNQQQTNMVKNAGRNIKGAVEEYMRRNNLTDRIKNFNWEFNLIEDKNANAFCMPGGKVAFYTGIMPICQNETGVAVVMGHEVAHAIAEHGNERMTLGLAQQLGGAGLAVALRNKPQETQSLALTAFGVGSTVFGILPYSRLHESEADKLGLIFMAMAGYDPHESVRFWERMEAQSKGAPPEFISTHPSHNTRIRNLRKAIPEAMKYYKSGDNSARK